MAAPGPHQMVTCPYNASHQIEHYKIQFHLEKCRKQHPNCTKATCPFDATHIFSEIEMDFHIKNCPKRLNFDKMLYTYDDENRPQINVPPPPPVVQSEENWEDEDVPSYQPDLAKKGPHIIRKIKGATPAERRKARCEGIRTFKPLPNNENQK